METENRAVFLLQLRSAVLLSSSHASATGISKVDCMRERQRWETEKRDRERQRETGRELEELTNSEAVGENGDWRLTNDSAQST